MQFSKQYFQHALIQNENVESVVQTLLAIECLFKNKIPHQLSAQYPQTHTYSVRRGLALQRFSLIPLLICTADAHLSSHLMISLASYSDQTVFYNKAFMLQLLLQGPPSRQQNFSYTLQRKKKDRFIAKYPESVQ